MIIRQKIRDHTATFTMTDVRDDGTTLWKVDFAGSTHFFTVEEWQEFGAAWCVWALDKTKRYPCRSEIAS